MWTAVERIKEAEKTGASAIATTCPWCIKNFNEAIARKGSSLKVYDIIELTGKSDLRGGHESWL